MLNDDFDIDEDIEALEHRLDGLFYEDMEHKDRFLAAIAAYLKSIPAVALLSDIPSEDIISMYRRTGN